MTSCKSVLNSFVVSGKHLVAIVGVGPNTPQNAHGKGVITPPSMEELTTSSINHKTNRGKPIRDYRKVKHEADEAERRAAAIEKRDAARRLRRH